MTYGPPLEWSSARKARKGRQPALLLLPFEGNVHNLMKYLLIQYFVVRNNNLKVKLVRFTQSYIIKSPRILKPNGARRGHDFIALDLRNGSSKTISCHCVTAKFHEVSRHKSQTFFAFEQQPSLQTYALQYYVLYALLGSNAL